MRKLLIFLLVFLVFALPALAESGQDHVWGEWLPAESGGHTALCAEDGETMNVKHTSYSVTLGEEKVSVCGVCGHFSEGVLPILPGASAVSQKAKPSSQRGTFLVRGAPLPFPGHSEVLFAFTALYENNGALATWKDVSTVTVSLNTNLPENARLIRVSPASGDDSVQNPEQWIEMEYTVTEGCISFTTKTPALYLILQ